jgi:hypothetical protein
MSTAAGTTPGPTPTATPTATPGAARRRRTTVPTQLAAMLAGVTEATIRKWASRGKLTRYGRPGRAEYDIDEIYELVVDTRSDNAM